MALEVGFLVYPLTLLHLVLLSEVLASVGAVGAIVSLFVPGELAGLAHHLALVLTSFLNHTFAEYFEQYLIVLLGPICLEAFSLFISAISLLWIRLGEYLTSIW